MRIFGWKCIRAIAVGLSVATAIGVATLARSTGLCRFSKIDGARTFYLYTASSQALQKDTLTFWESFSVKGESVRFACKGEQAQAIAERIVKAYGATVVYTEEACGVQSFYAYVGNGWESVCVNGERVNLHIAVNGDNCTVGTPIVFGGF